MSRIEREKKDAIDRAEADAEQAEKDRLAEEDRKKKEKLKKEREERETKILKEKPGLEAALLLSAAKQLIRDGKKSVAMVKLRQIISDYPKAAKEAGELLKK